MFPNTEYNKNSVVDDQLPGESPRNRRSTETPPLKQTDKVTHQCLSNKFDHLKYERLEA